MPFPIKGQDLLGSVGKPHRRSESEQFFRLAKTGKQAMSILSSIQSDTAKCKKAARSQIGFPERPLVISNDFGYEISRIWIGIDTATGMTARRIVTYSRECVPA